VFRRSCLPLLFLCVVIGASCSGDTVSFEGQRAVDAAATAVESPTIEPDEPETVDPVEVAEPTAARVEPKPTVEVIEEQPEAASGLDDETVEAQLQVLESPGGMVYLGDERECIRTTLVGSDPQDPAIDTSILNCLDDDGIHRWVSAQLGAIGQSERAIVDATETACVWEQSGGQVFSISAASSPAIQRCGVWGRVNLGGVDGFSDELLTCLDVQVQATRLPDGTDRTAVDERVGQCATPDELAVWNNL